VTSLPTWAVWVLSFGSPSLTAAIAVLAQYFGHRAARELEIRSKREEVMRNLRWAAELAASDDAKKALLGVVELKALRDSKMLSEAELGFIYAALDDAIEGPRQAINQSAGEVEVVVRCDADVAGGIPVSWGEEDEGEEADTQ
jgi:hypothetical protein